jgi:hypothetical protein
MLADLKVVIIQTRERLLHSKLLISDQVAALGKCSIEAAMAVGQDAD